MRDQERQIQEWICQGDEKMANNRIQADADKPHRWCGALFFLGGKNGLRLIKYV